MVRRSEGLPTLSTTAIALASTCIALAIASTFDPRLHGVLDYRRSAVVGGEVWRLLTAHAVHLTIAHAVLDIGALLLVAWIFDDELGPGQQAAVCLLGAVGVDVGLLLAHPELERYAGLSGLLHAWFAAGAVGWALTVSAVGSQRTVERRAWGIALFVGLSLKLALESRRPAFWLDGASFEVVTSAHRWGAAAGLSFGIGVALFRRVHRFSNAGVASRPR